MYLPLYAEVVNRLQGMAGIANACFSRSKSAERWNSQGMAKRLRFGRCGKMHRIDSSLPSVLFAERCCTWTFLDRRFGRYGKSVGYKSTSDDSHSSRF